MLTKNNNLPAYSLKCSLIVLLVLTSSCHNKKNMYFNQEMSQDGWSRYNIPLFTAEITDTLSSFDLLFSIRNNHRYPYRNIFMFVTTTAPSGASIRDTVEYQLASEKGKWYGKGLGDIYNMSVPFKNNVTFPYKGTYKFRIEHGMRTDELVGITDVGLIIKKQKNKSGRGQK